MNEQTNTARTEEIKVEESSFLDPPKNHRLSIVLTEAMDGREPKARTYLSNEGAVVIRSELNRLHAIEQALHKTVDGVAVTNGSRVYRETRTTGKVEEHIVELHARALCEPHGINWSASECYSTPDAAEAARGDAEGGEA